MKKKLAINIKRIALVSFLLIFFLTGTYGQKGFLKNRVLIESNLGLQFGSETIIDIAMSVGFLVTDRFIVGAGGSFDYFQATTIYNTSIQTFFYGPKVYARYHVIENAFAHIEYESLCLESKYFDLKDEYDTERFWIHNLYVGGGYSQKINKKSMFNLIILFNLNDQINSPYANPVIRLGYVVNI